LLLKLINESADVQQDKVVSWVSVAEIRRSVSPVYADTNQDVGMVWYLWEGRKFVLDDTPCFAVTVADTAHVDSLCSDRQTCYRRWNGKRKLEYLMISACVHGLSSCLQKLVFQLDAKRGGHSPE